MKPLSRDELIPYADYEVQRSAFRDRLIELKRRRRISLGPRITLLFENRLTVQFQVQEMIRAERIVQPEKVQHELDVYNAQLPAEGELSATLFIEITGSDRIKEELDAFQGIDRGDTLAIRAGGQTLYGLFEGGHSKEDKISAVHFLRFPLTAAFRNRLAAKEGELSLTIRHRHYRAEAAVPEALRQEWLADLGLEASSALG